MNELIAQFRKELLDIAGFAESTVGTIRDTPHIYNEKPGSGGKLGTFFRL
jgi:hypothetical protein